LQKSCEIRLRKRVRNNMNAKGLLDLPAQESEQRVPKLLKRKKFTFARFVREGPSAETSGRLSKMNRGNTRHVSTNVTITEAISMERLNLGVGWRFWRVERKDQKVKNPSARHALGDPDRRGPKTVSTLWAGPLARLLTSLESRFRGSPRSLSEVGD